MGQQNLFSASHQWATRPADERFSTLEDMQNAVNDYKERATVLDIDMKGLEAVDKDGDLFISDKVGHEMQVGHFAFGQLSQMLGAPPTFLRKLPGDLVRPILNYGMNRLAEDEAQTKMLFHRNDDSVLIRAITSPRYGRIWNCDVLPYLFDLRDRGWRVPPARPAIGSQAGSRQATAEDVLNQANFGLSIKVGDWIAPAGLYASDHDMYAFMVNDQCRIDDGTDEGLARGFFLSNTEVGGAALKLTKFNYRFVCGNHIVWDASDVKEFRIVHRGKNEFNYGNRLVNELRIYGQESAAYEETRIKEAKNCILGHDKNSVIETLFKAKVLGKGALEAIYPIAVQEAEEHGTDPRSVWGFVQGITQASQKSDFADERVELDRASGKVLLLSKN